ncbi:UDP-N-acetylmuramoyl-L-alanine--D-glutamate ligase [Hydrogenivirga sp. 128-5-R1-1]|uniref:UDP-N-acetylmuramoyl-L-alanine--D-glutamate ligase n=1 Tax=Hydrogenivirga sp. 128-5-R1-1 TaxID=392423 RepID=UPI00015F3626|nr:UDP-N-acetylmuramoyl-L-alanine--D-glutamate ligase [Hydrogenivirga sp. 128-5-R1-1]EDP76622.1 UDP-N-acetylmuramoylalanine-D-glutamate ligase [Hydrogenivirga sp. 128-5-R1-1]
MKTYLVWGLGKSGLSAVQLLKEKGCKVYSGDDAKGDSWEEFIDSVDVVVLSPGVPPRHPLWKEALKRDIEVIGELELAYRFFEGDVVAITGTDGKSTTTRLTSLMLSKKIKDVHEAGNIGTPLSEVVMSDPKSTAVVEVSSFQGRTLNTFRPSVGAFLNFHEDHLDWHPDLGDYLRSKHNIFSRQEPRDTFIAGSLQDEVLSTPTQADRVVVDREVVVAEGRVLFRGELLFELGDLRLKGAHNLKNAVVASIIARLKGVSTEDIREVLREFRGLPFRMELVKVWRGVEIYNDSKSTTPNALKAALESFPDGSVILIAGGKDKGADFKPLRETAERKLKLAFLIGETRESMKTAFGGGSNIKTMSSLEEAVDSALRVAEPGDFVLFSPGCSSFDMFSSYVERGEAFNTLIEERCKL